MTMTTMQTEDTLRKDELPLLHRVGRKLRSKVSINSDDSSQGSRPSSENDCFVRATQPSHVPKEVITSIEFLRAQQQKPTFEVSLQEPEFHPEEAAERDYHVAALAEYLASRPTELDEQTLSCLQLLLLETLSSSSRADLEEAWRFLTDPSYSTQDTLEDSTDSSSPTWEPPLAQLVLWWELRALILKRKRESRDQRSSSWILQGSDTVAGYISASAHWMEHGLRSSVVPAVHSGLDRAGHAAKQTLTPSANKSVFSSPQEEVVTLAYTEAAARMSSTVHRTAKTTVNAIRDVSTDSIQYLADKFKEHDIGERLVNDAQHREILSAAGRVGMASVGAAAIVGEALWEATRSVAHKTSYVTADVVRHKYGDGAGRLVEHASDTTGNIVRTAAHVAMLEVSVLAKVVAKNTGKVHVRRTVSARGAHEDYDDTSVMKQDVDTATTSDEFSESTLSSGNESIHKIAE